jgi:hypothetical protein
MVGDIFVIVLPPQGGLCHAFGMRRPAPVRQLHCLGAAISKAPEDSHDCTRSVTCYPLSLLAGHHVSMDSSIVDPSAPLSRHAVFVILPHPSFLERLAHLWANAAWPVALLHQQVGSKQACSRAGMREGIQIAAYVSRGGHDEEMCNDSTSVLLSSNINVWPVQYCVK